MEDIKIDTWSDFKGFVDARSISIQWLDMNDYYYMKAIDGLFSVYYLMEKFSPASSDQTDFETNYKSYGNSHPYLRSSNVLSDDDLDLYAQGYSFNPTMNATSSHDYAFQVSSGTKLLYMKGGIMWVKNPGEGDHVDCQIVDVDGIYTPAGTVLITYTKDWQIIPENTGWIEHEAITSSPLNGLYLRTVYTSVTATVQANVKVNMKAFERVA